MTDKPFDASVVPSTASTIDWSVIAALLQRAFPALAGIPVAQLAVGLAVIGPFALAFGTAVEQAFAAAQQNTIDEGWVYVFSPENPAQPPHLIQRPKPKEETQ